MVYIYRKSVGNKPYYYLRASSRRSGKMVTKDIAYLGSSIEEVQKSLGNLRQYAAEIRKAHRTLNRFINKERYLEIIRAQKPKKSPYLSTKNLRELEAARLHHQKEFITLDPKTKDEIYKQFIIDFAFNTTSIEGNTITLKEAQRLLEDDMLPKDRTLREVYDLQNTERVFFSLIESPPSLKEKTAIDVHDQLLDRIDDRKGYRTHDVRIFRSRFEATPAKYIPTDMKILIQWYERHKALHPLALAGLFHHKFERIHPFADGNGRTGRMLLNLILMKNGYPPMIVPKKRRAAYLQALQSADSADLESIDEKAYGPLCEYLAEEFIHSYWDNFDI